MSVEEARRAPVQRLSDRLSFGVGDVAGMGDFGSDVDDTMMDILANRNNASFGENDTFNLGMDEYGPAPINPNTNPLIRSVFLSPI